MTDEPVMAAKWVRVSPAPDPIYQQGRATDLYWNADDQEWCESPDEATEYNDAEQAALDLSRFGDGIEWWRRIGD